MKGKKFTQILLKWNKESNNRPMPWKGEKDPYKVWLSEVILQQTRVEQGWRYYENFVQTYPDVQSLAAADDEAVFKLWEGLGYYSRCKNLLFTARTIVKEHSGRFPDSYDEILKLKGVGPYTASAIASFCFNLPYAVIDGNVFRILARIFGIDTPIDSAKGKQEFKELAEKLLDRDEPGLYNQAIMDFGATVCKPALPLCNTCYLNSICTAYKTAAVSNLPVKEKILQKKHRWFSYFIFRVNGFVFTHKRTAKDIWQNLYEFYLVESEAASVWTDENIQAIMTTQLGVKKYENVSVITAVPQQLTHQTIKGYFISINLAEIPEVLNGENGRWVTAEQMNNLPFPGFINQYLQNKNVQASLF